MKLKSIKLNNFRLFEDAEFEFKPLTILTGPNSSGKSSVVKALMLLQENMKAPNYLGRLTFKSGKHRLGNFDSILSINTEVETVKFEIKYINTEFIRTDKNKRHLLEDSKMINVTYEYFQDAIQKENGFLINYSIAVTDENNSSTKILSMKKTVHNTYEWFLNKSWFINGILEKDLFRYSPKIHKIWDRLTLVELEEEIKRRRKAIETVKNKELDNLDSFDFEDIKIKTEKEKYRKRLSEINYLLSGQYKTKNFRRYSEKQDEINKKYQNLLEETEELILKNEVKEIEIEKQLDLNENHLNLNKELKKVVGEQKKIIERKQQLEISKQDELRELEKQKEQYELGSNNIEEDEKLKIEKSDIISQIEEIDEQISLAIRAKYHLELSNVREGKIRSLLYNQIELASKNYLKSLIDLDLDTQIDNLGKLTISDYLKQKEWGNIIYALTNINESIAAIDIIKWSDETNFIAKSLEEDRRSENKEEKGKIKFSELIGKGVNNQLAELLISKIEEIINIFLRPLPFIPISATRGVQQRLYRSSQSQYHLEEALSKLLSMQYENKIEQLNFVQKWIRLFGIGNKHEKLVAKVIEGDFVQGYIVNQEGNQMNIADKGLGIAQLLPIIIYTADAIKKSQLICIEEPGTHLHPDLQELLINFMVDVNNNYGTQFLIETHSGVLINSIHYTLKDERKLLNQSNLRIYFLEGLITKNIFTLNQVKFSNVKGIDRFYLDYWKKFLGNSSYKQRRERREIESQKSYFEKRFKEFKGHIKCIVLTEDENTLNIRNLLWHSGFNKEETEVRHFEGCTNIAAAKILARFIQERFRETVIIIHRDRDYLTDDDVKEFKENLEKINIYPFITDGTDIEAYFLNYNHLQQVFSLTKEQALAKLNEAKNMVRNESLNRLRIKEFGEKHKSKSTHLEQFIESLYEDSTRYIYGKGAYIFLKKQLGKEIGRLTPHIRVEALVKFSTQIWNV